MKSRRMLPAVLLALAAPLSAAPPLTAEPGDVERGRRLFVARDGGHCILCHAVDGLDAPFQGNVGPPLTGVASRLTSAEIRDRIIDPTVRNPEAAMPAYFRSTGLRQLGAGQRGETVLTAGQVEDLVAWLATLKDPR